MSVESVIKTLETDAKDALDNGINWIQQVVGTHLPGAITELKNIAGSGLFKDIEDALLNPAEQAAVSGFIRMIVGLRGQQAPAEQPAEPVADPAPDAAGDGGVPAGDQSAA